MAYYPKSSGLGNSAAYQVAGKPFLTGSTIDAEGTVGGVLARKEYVVEFPTVTKRIVVNNVSPSTDIILYFSPKAAAPATVAGNHVALIPCHTGSLDLDIKCTKLYITAGAAGTFSNPADNTGYLVGGFQVRAELTGIPATEMYALTGSGINVSNTSDGVH
jgi:hypothetical protein